MFRGAADQALKHGGARRYTVPLSVVAHSAVLVTLIVLPLLAADTLPIPPRFLSFITTVPTALPLPPRAPSRTNNADRGTAVVAANPTPLRAPSGIGQESIAPRGEPIPGAIEAGDGLVPEGVFGESVVPPPPNPSTTATSAPVRAGGQIRPPTKIRDVPLVYPSLAQASRVEGVVIIEATIGVDGRVQNATILRSIPLLDAAALAAVRQWEYTPTLLNGSPVPVIITVTVAFKLR
jgi:protein TonB